MLLPTDLKAFTRLSLQLAHEEQLLWQLLELALLPAVKKKYHPYISVQKPRLSLKQVMIGFTYQLAVCHRHSLKHWLHPAHAQCDTAEREDVLYKFPG